MLPRADPSSNTKVWKQEAYPNLLLDILHSQHHTIDYLTQLAGHFFVSTLLDRRAAALTESIAPQEIKRILFSSPPF